MRLVGAAPCFGISKSTAHRRVLIWSRAGVWGQLQEEIVHRLGDAGLLNLSRAVLVPPREGQKRGATHRSESRGPGQAARPVGGERTASPRRHRRGQRPRQPRAQANDHRSPSKARPTEAAISSLTACMPTRPTTFLTCGNGCGVGTSVSVSPAKESSERLGRRRWVIERTMSWITGYRRLNHRYEHHPRNYLASRPRR
ncbi:transposase [Streptomyces sp. NPDC048508]|uniref:transposase n=1 Tax=Streptomyces sp. NPDC048508 TaxID=3365561 RepID=UPI003721BC2B